MSTMSTSSPSAVHRALNQLISDFWRGSIQHQAHVAVLRALGVTALATDMSTRIADEPMTLVKLTDRLLDLEGQLDLEVGKPAIGHTLREVLTQDLALQQQARPRLNEAAELMAAEHDALTRRLIEDILLDEEAHLAWLKNEVSLLDRLGEATYLASRI